MISETDEEYHLFRVLCNDRRCKAELYVTSINSPVECFHCGQKISGGSFQDVQEVPRNEMKVATALYIRRLLISNSLPKRGTEMVKVLGLSNYYCKLLSPFLTKYGMDKATGKAKLLREMNKGDIFDCSSFGDRAFLIEPEHIEIPGFGRDITGSTIYLSETLKMINSSNGGQERLLPIHADGDGHCLVHAISRALVGRELFWHPLRCCLKKHFEMNLDKFKELFKDFIDTDEWQSIIDECDPEFKPPEGELHGLRNIHIFGLANVLRRPIILLDSLECMKRSGDYSGLFLPGFIGPEGCKGKDDTLNKPICIAWSSYSHNHYIPLVGVDKLPLPVLPPSLIPKVWGMPQSEIASYIEFDENGNCTIGGNRVLSDAYIQQLVRAMEGQFFEQHGVHPTLVADTKLFLYSDNVLLNTQLSTVIHKAKSSSTEQRLFRCTSCGALIEISVDANFLRRGGFFYASLLNAHKKLIPGATFLLPVFDIVCHYDSLRDALIPNMATSKLEKCSWCQCPTVYKVRPDGSIVTPSNPVFEQNKNAPKACDKAPEEKAEDLPKMLTLKVEKNNVVAEDVIPDFQLVSEEALEGAVSHIASNFIKKHFPDEVGNSEFHNYVCDEILKKIGKTIPVPSTSGDTQTSTDDVKPTVEEMVTETNSIAGLKESKIEPKPSTSKLQIIKIVASNGRQVSLNLNDQVLTYSYLQECIFKEFDIPIENQRIKMGFPPKVLEGPYNAVNQALPLKHGDRLIVENCPRQENKPRNTPYIRNPARDFSSPNLSNFKSEMMWNLAKHTPEQFRKGGGLYEEIATKKILTDMVHVFLEAFPNKTFSYNYSSDCIELCVKPLGHFEITPDLDSRIEQVQQGESVNGYRKCPVMSLKTGHKDPTPSRAVKKNVSSNAQSSTENLSVPLVRKGPGFSVLTSPESSERMDIS